MVALMCECCCRDYYIPNFKINYRFYDDNYERIDNVVYRRVSFSFSFSVVYRGKPLPCDYFFGQWVLFYPADLPYPDSILDLKFPFSRYDYVRYSILKPEFLGKYYWDISIGSDDSYFDIVISLYRDKQNYSDVVELLMERFAPCFSRLYYYYLPILKPGPTDYYARLLTYDEFISAIRSKFEQIFNYFYTNNKFSWPRLDGRYFENNFTIEKEPHTNADL